MKESRLNGECKLLAERKPFLFPAAQMTPSDEGEYGTDCSCGVLNTNRLSPVTKRPSPRHPWTIAHQSIACSLLPPHLPLISTIKGI